MKTLKTLFVFATSFTLAAFAGVAAAKHLSDKSVNDRLKPVHSVYVEGDDVPQVANAAPVSNEPAGPRAAGDIYNTYCMACHATGVAGAPKVGDAAAWTARTANGIDAVYSNAINGINAMPPKGTCADCSDDEIKAVVDHMLENSK
ncbi:MAG: cytochrome c5 family protein [Kangiellaceae bacterium]|nr:cytochrome c5 family protein [Kangiellaceae bacterium]